MPPEASDRIVQHIRMRPAKNFEDGVRGSLSQGIGTAVGNRFGRVGHRSKLRTRHLVDG